MLQVSAMRWLVVLCALTRWVFADSMLEDFAGDASLKTASVGVAVIPLEGDEGALEWQADTALIPASTMKAITTATVLGVLGTEWVFETRLFLKGDDLIIKGGGDPTLGATGVDSDFGGWLEALKAEGISEIKGRVIADASRFESQTTPNDWPWGDVGNYYGAGPSGLNFHLNAFDLTFRPAGVGKRAELISTDPKPPGVEFENHMLTGPAGSGDQGYAYGGPGARMISLRGTVPAGGNFTIKGALPDPPMFCALSFKDYLVKNGIPVAGEVAAERVNIDDAQLLHTQKSPPLTKIITATNHRSVNLYADSMFKALSPEGTTAASSTVLRKHWEDRGVDLTGFVFYDGSGLSPRNTVTARQMAMILKKARDHETGEVFYKSLPVAGESGTLSDFGGGTAIAGKVHAKSGGMTRVRTYAGYLTAQSGKEFSFAVFTNNSIANPKKAIVELLVKIVKSR